MSSSLIWFVLGVVFFVAELMTPAMVLLFFGVGAWAAAVLALLDFRADGQIIAFISVTLITLLALRRRLRTVFGGKSLSNNENPADPSPAQHPLAGQRGTVSRGIVPGSPGEVSVGGSFWRAMAATPLAPGRDVVVLGADPHNTLLLMVAAADQENSPAPDKEDA